MGKPLLMVNTTPFIKIKPKKVVIVGKKKAVKKKAKKPVVPVRPSPYKIGDFVWVQASGREWTKWAIVKHLPPVAKDGELVWRYGFDKSLDPIYDEHEILPASIFTLIATDAVKMKTAPFQDELNKQFGGDALILQVFREKQKRPWAYYVIPDSTLLWEKKKHEVFPYGDKSYKVDRESWLLKKPADALQLRLLPVSSAPQEIMTYLGIHIYGRKWVRNHDTEL